MKKYFTIAAMAIMALTSALSFTSCSEQDPITPNVTPDTTPVVTTVSYNGTVSTAAKSVQSRKDLVKELNAYLKAQLGSVTTSVSVYPHDTVYYNDINVSLQTKSSMAKALSQKLTEMQSNTSTLDGIVDGLKDLTACHIQIADNHGSLLLDYEFDNQATTLGTWEGTTKAGETVTLKITSTKDKEDGLVSILTIGTTEYKGFTYSVGKHYLFNSTQVGEDALGVRVSVVRAYLPVDNPNSCVGKLDILNQGRETITFTKK